MRLRSDNQLLLANIEDTYGTAKALTGADAIQCDFELEPMIANQKEFSYSRPHYGNDPVIHTQIHRGIKLSNIGMAGSGDPAVAPAWVRIMRACGWAADVQPTGTTLNPTSDRTAFEGMTLEPSEDGEMFRLIGARGSMSAVFAIDDFAKLSADMKGGWVDPATLGAIPEPNYSAWRLPLPANCSNSDALVIDGESYPWYEFAINQNSGVEFYCVPGETGQRVEITNRRMTGKVKLQAKQVGDHNIFSLVKSNARVPVSLVHGDVAGDIIEGAGPQVQFTNPRKADYKGDLAWELDMILCPNTGDDEWVWTTK